MVGGGKISIPRVNGLNPRQARWSLFFSRFDFKVTYRPGSKNGKADALSRQFDHLPISNTAETILPSTIILAPVEWDIMTEISEALISDPAPVECPPDRTYVPPALRLRVMQWVHELPSAIQVSIPPFNSPLIASGGQPYNQM